MTFRGTPRSVFLTGATGFVGRRVLSTLAEADEPLVVHCLTRQPRPVHALERIQSIRGELTDPETYLPALRTCDTVLHLAAATGKAKPEEYFRVNVRGTRALLQASKNCGVSRFIFVSSIAAAFSERRAYHYAQSKTQAEEAVRESGLSYAIVRPTIILGPDSPIAKGLIGLASLPVTPVFGTGQVLVQPVDVDDVARFLKSLMMDRDLPNRAMDLGGPDVMTLDSLLQTVRRGLGKPDPHLIHLPVRTVISFLAFAEKWIYPVLPVTAGQLSLFVNDSVARPDPLIAERLGAMKSVRESVQRLTAHG
jgi:NADH dehydrogenase